MKYLILCLLLLASQAMAWTRVDTMFVTTGANDVRVNAGTFGSTNTSIIVGKFNDDTFGSGCWRVMSKIPAGQTITSAYLEVVPRDSVGRDVRTNLYFENANNPAIPTDATDFNARTLTSAVSWNFTDGWTLDARKSTPDLSSILTTPYAAGNCDSGEFINVFWKGTTAPSGSDQYRSVYTYDDTPSLAAYLIVTHETAAAVNDTFKVVYIMAGADTTVRNANIDSLRYDIVNDPQGQLPGIWQMDIITRASAEGQSAAFWALYDLIVCWGTEENSSASDFRTSIDGILDTIHKPIIMRDAFAAYGDPMYLGTAARAVSSDWMKINDTDRGEFIVRKTYTDNFNFGDSVRIYTVAKQTTHGLRGMAHEVKTLARYDGDLINTDADTALIAICYAADTNAANTLAPAKRAYFGLVPNWRYASWSARDLWFRTLRWAVDDTLIDTCVTQTRITREGIDGSWMERSGAVCQMYYHYGGFGTIFTGWDVRDRGGLIRARTTAINTQLPDTSDDWAYDIGDVQLRTVINGIDEEIPSNTFSFWEGLFKLDYDTLWRDHKVTIQLDSTCAFWVSTEEHELSNSYYLKYPSIPWDSPQASTRGTDYEVAAYDSIWIQDPLLEQVLTWRNLKTPFLLWMADSATNQGVITHTIGTVTNDAEIKLYSEQATANFQSVRSGPQFIVPLTWRAANTGAADLDSTILIQDLLGNDSLEFTVLVNGDIPNSQTLVVSNSGSAATFGCATTEEDPDVAWLTTSIIGGGTTTYYVICGVDQTGLAAGYYSTDVTATCADVSNSPYSIKVILHVEAEPAREATGTVKIQ